MPILYIQHDITQLSSVRREGTLISCGRVCIYYYSTCLYRLDERIECLQQTGDQGRVPSMFIKRYIIIIILDRSDDVELILINYNIVRRSSPTDRTRRRYQYRFIIFENFKKKNSILVSSISRYVFRWYRFERSTLKISIHFGSND